MPFQWTLAAHDAFQALKEQFTSAPILVMPDPERQFVFEVDVSDVGVGAVLSQTVATDQKLHPCTFFSWRKPSQYIALLTLRITIQYCNTII